MPARSWQPASVPATSTPGDQAAAEQLRRQFVARFGTDPVQWASEQQNAAPARGRDWLLVDVLADQAAEYGDRFWQSGVLDDPGVSGASQLEDEHHVDQELVDAETQLRQWNDELERVPADDVEQWQHATRTAAGTLSLLGTGTPGPTGEDFTVGAREFSRQVCRPGAMTLRTAGPSRGELAARHIHVALRATSPDQHRGWFAVMKQLNRTARAIHAAQEARGQLATARQTYANVVGLLEQTHAHTDAALDSERQRIQSIHSFATDGRTPTTSASDPRERDRDHAHGHAQDKGRSRGLLGHDTFRRSWVTCLRQFDGLGCA